MPYKDKEKAKEYRRLHYLLNREKYSNYAKNYFKKNKNKIYAYKNALYSTELGKELKLKYFRNYYKKSKYKILEKQKIWSHTDRGRMLLREKAERLRNNFPNKFRSRNILNKAVISGKIKRQTCQYKGCNKRKVEAHHKNYDKPLDVVWLCNYHHRLIENRVFDHV